MNLELTPELKQLQKSTREVVDALLPHERDLAETGQVPQVVFDQLRDLGYLGVAIPEEFGGIGLGALGAAVVFCELGRLPMSFYPAVRGSGSIGTRILLNRGSEEQRQRWLPGVASGQVLTAFGLTEPNAGSDAASIQSTAVRHGEHYVLNGSKIFITNGHVADLVTVMAYTDKSMGAGGGVSAFLVEKGTPGFQVASMVKTMAGDPCYTSELVFDNCRVPAANLLGEEGKGFRYAMECLDEGRIVIAAVAVGQAEYALELAVNYARERVAFGKPIAEYQAIQHMLADVATDLYAARCMLLDAAGRHEQGERVPQQCSMVKLFCTEAAWRAVDKCLQVFGGMGYSREVPLERLYREVRLLRIVEGTSEIQRNIIGRNLFR